VKKLKDILATAFLLGSLILVGTLLVIGVYVHILHEGGVAEHTATVPQRAIIELSQGMSNDPMSLNSFAVYEDTTIASTDTSTDF
jgi:hypothetical protein